MPWPPPMHAVDNAVLRLAAPQLVQQRDQQTRAGRTQRMAERDRSAIHVDLLAIEAELFLDRQVLRGEGFVHFDQVDVVELQPGLFQRDARRGNRALSP